jgi:putative tricarboxylic transport membrane protein
MEVNLRRAMAISNGDVGFLFSSPIAIALWVLAALSLFAPSLLNRLRQQRALGNEEL